MRRLALLLAALAACVHGPGPADDPGLRSPRLNSERIEQRFGSYGVEVLEADARVRVSNLYSLHDGHRVCRTFAVVRFAPAIDPRVAAEHAEIVAGGSIGAVFEDHGWTVAKRQRLLSTLPAMAPGDRIDRLMRLSAPVPLAIDVYTLSVSRGGESVDYATIAEVYHPDYLGVEDLRALYGTSVPDAAGNDAELVDLLALVGRQIASGFRCLSPRKRVKSASVVPLSLPYLSIDAALS